MHVGKTKVLTSEVAQPCSIHIYRVNVISISRQRDSKGPEAFSVQVLSTNFGLGLATFMINSGFIFVLSLQLAESKTWEDLQHRGNRVGKDHPNSSSDNLSIQNLWNFRC